MRQYLGRLLAGAYDVEEAADGVAALAAARERPPDLVLADVMMPGLDGFGLLGELRGDPRTKTVPVVLLSARTGEESRVEGLAAGADDYLAKPFSARELLARVNVHLEMARVRRQAARRESELLAEARQAQEQAAAILEGITDGFVALDRGAPRWSSSSVGPWPSAWPSNSSSITSPGTRGFKTRFTRRRTGGFPSSTTTSPRGSGRMKPSAWPTPSWNSASRNGRGSFPWPTPA
jgi:CheY-like chemotaxis protein